MKAKAVAGIEPAFEFICIRFFAKCSE